MAIDRFTRSRIIFGEDGFQKLQNSTVLILGVGGVGSFVLDSLYRSGIGNITIVDFDKFDITNQNRQIGSENVGETKVYALKKIYENIEAIEQKIDKEWIDRFDFDRFDVVIDAIDDIDAKVEIAKKCYKKLFSSTGSAKKFDPTKIEVASIWKCYGDKFAKKFKENLKKSRFNGNFKVVFSAEEIKCKELGSFSAVTGSFGLTLASLTVRKILGHKV